MNEPEMKKIIEEISELLIMKNKTYGDKNIDKIGKSGIITRLEEKLERLKHMIENNIQDKETVEDTWKDIIGYAVIGIMLERGRWN